MAISVLQAVSAAWSTGTAVSVTLTATTAGSILVVGATVGGISTPTITISDQHSDTYTDSGKGVINSSFESSKMGAFLTLTSGTTTATATFGGGTVGFGEIIAWEVAGLTSASFDKVANSTGTTGTAMSSGATGTLTSATEIALGYLISNAGCNAGSGNGGSWVNDINFGGNAGLTPNQNYAEHLITAATTSLTATATQASGGFNAWCVTLMSAAGDTLGGAMQRMFM